MAQPVRTVTDEVVVSYHRFDLEDADRDNVEEPPSHDWLPKDNLTVRQGIVYMVSPGHTFSALVTMQSWSEEPPMQPEGLWETTADLDLVCRSGIVTAVNGTRDHRTAPLLLSDGPMVYHVRVNSRGHERMRELEGGGGIPEEGEEDRPGEEYLFQFWPARPIPDELAPPSHPKRSPRVPDALRQP